MKTKVSVPELKAKDDAGFDLLMVTPYEKGMIYVRRISGGDLFLWDAVFDGQLYSASIRLTLGEKKDYDQADLKVAIQMCYAGAATTIDTLMGKNLKKTDKENVEIFESARAGVEGKKEA